MAKRINKFLYGWKLYVNYGQGWEYETFENTFKGYKENRKAYREECRYPQRWSRGREFNPDAVNAAVKSIMGNTPEPTSIGDAVAQAMTPQP